MTKKTIVIIRNAASYDFGGGERVPVFIAQKVAQNSDLKPIILSSSKKLLDFAQKESVPNMKSWWWSKQNWSGANIFLTPFYVLWQIVLYFYYIMLFLNLKPTVVHLQSKDDFIAGTFAARTLNIRVIWSDYADLKHVLLNYKIWYKNPIGKMVYFAGRFTESIIVVSEEDKSLVSVNIPNENFKAKLKVIYYGAFDAYKNTEKNKSFTFISSGRLVTDKGIGELISAFKKFHKLHPDASLDILGNGPEKDFFKQAAKSNSAITFLGHKSNPLDYVEKAQVFIIPTYHEGFSIALVEACMLGMPVIATNVGGNPEIIKDRETGLLVKVKDVDGLDKAMEELYNDSQLRETLGQNARAEYIEKFNFETIIKQQFIPLYEASKK